MEASQKIVTTQRWNARRAEDLLGSLTGVISASVVEGGEGGIAEIHLLTAMDITPKQTVRNVESALLAKFNVRVDHRKISVAQTSAPEQGSTRAEPVIPLGKQHRPRVAPMKDTGSGRLIFKRQRVELDRSRVLRIEVVIGFGGEEYPGVASGADTPRARAEIASRATLTAIRSIVESNAPAEVVESFDLGLRGVNEFDAFGRTFVLVAVHAISGLETKALAGAAPNEDSEESAVIVATLQATDRWIRGLL